MLAETCILGLMVGVSMFGAIIGTLFRNSRANRQNIVFAITSFVPLGLFFSLQLTADFCW